MEQMEQAEDKPAPTDDLPKTAPKSTGGLQKTSPLKERRAPLSDLELYAFYAVFSLLVLLSLVVPQRILDEWEMAILLFVGVPFLSWGVRVILKTG